MLKLLSIVVFLISNTNGFNNILKVSKINLKLNAITKSGVFYGNYDEANYNSMRNQYFWGDCLNILPANNVNIRLITSGWIMSYNQNLSTFNDNYIKFINSIENKNIETFMWVPYLNKSNLLALINCYIDRNNRFIYIQNILMKPYTEKKDFELLMSDLKQINIMKEYKTFKIIYDVSLLK